MLPLPLYQMAACQRQKQPLPLISTLLWWKPMNGPTSEELHSPDETPVFGATDNTIPSLLPMTLLMIFALQSVKECSHSKLHTQFEPVSKWTPHCRMLLVAFPFDTLRLKRVAEEYSVRFARLPSTVQSTSMLAMMWQPSPMKTESSREQYSMQAEGPITHRSSRMGSKTGWVPSSNNCLMSV